MTRAAPPIIWREEPCAADAAAVAELLGSTGFFHAHEIDVAVELVQTRLQSGVASGYHFVFADVPGDAPHALRTPGPAHAPRVLGYACYGEIACTRGSFDLYWIGVHEQARHLGLGRRLLAEVERRVAAAGGRAIWVETSGRELYAPTHAFYLRCGYELVARLPEFYDPGDDKLVYVRKV